MSSFRVIQALGYLGGTVIVIGGFKMILSEYERLGIFEAKLSSGKFPRSNHENGRVLYFRMRGGSGNCLKRRSPGDMRHGDNISLPESVMDTSRPVKLKDFAEHYR